MSPPPSLLPSGEIQVPHKRDRGLMRQSFVLEGLCEMERAREIQRERTRACQSGIYFQQASHTVKPTAVHLMHYLTTFLIVLICLGA